MIWFRPLWVGSRRLRFLQLLHQSQPYNGPFSRQVNCHHSLLFYLEGHFLDRASTVWTLGPIHSWNDLQDVRIPGHCHMPCPHWDQMGPRDSLHPLMPFSSQFWSQPWYQTDSKGVRRVNAAKSIYDTFLMVEITAPHNSSQGVFQFQCDPPDNSKPAPAPEPIRQRKFGENTAPRELLLSAVGILKSQRTFSDQVCRCGNCSGKHRSLSQRQSQRPGKAMQAKQLVVWNTMVMPWWHGASFRMLRCNEFCAGIIYTIRTDPSARGPDHAWSRIKDCTAPSSGPGMKFSVTLPSATNHLVLGQNLTGARASGSDASPSQWGWIVPGHGLKFRTVQRRIEKIEKPRLWPLRSCFGNQWDDARYVTYATNIDVKQRVKQGAGFQHDAAGAMCSAVSQGSWGKTAFSYDIDINWYQM